MGVLGILRSLRVGYCKNSQEFVGSLWTLRKIPRKFQDFVWPSNCTASEREKEREKESRKSLGENSACECADQRGHPNVVPPQTKVLPLWHA